MTRGRDVLWWGVVAIAWAVICAAVFITFDVVPR